MQTNAKALQSPYIRKHGEILHAGKWWCKKVSFYCMLKILNVDSVTDESLLAEDCSRFLPPQHRTLGRRLFKDVSVVRQDPLMTQNANAVDLENWRHAVDCQSDMLVRDPSDTETRVLPAWTIFALVHEANADSEVEAWSDHADWHWTLVVLLS